MDAMSTQQLSQLRGQAAQLLRKYRIPLLVFLLGVALGQVVVDGDDVQTDSRTVTASGSTTQETETVFRQPGGSEKEPAVQSVVYPQYQGALVICDGAERASVRLAVTQAVSSLTGLGSNKIAVVKMKGQ